MMASIFALTKAQINELRLVRDEDGGYLARGDQADLVGLGLAKPPYNSSGYYTLTSSGAEARIAVIEKYGSLP